MSYAVIQLVGKQYKVTEGTVLTVNHMDTPADQTVTTSDVLLVHDGKTAKIGQPLVIGASVTLQVKSHQKADKIRVATYKAKSRYRRVKGHRQSETTLEVTKIVA